MSNSRRGSTDPFSLTILGFLIVSLSLGALAVIRNSSFDIRQRAQTYSSCEQQCMIKNPGWSPDDCEQFCQSQSQPKSSTPPTLPICPDYCENNCIADVITANNTYACLPYCTALLNSCQYGCDPNATGGQCKLSPQNVCTASQIYRCNGSTSEYCAVSGQPPVSAISCPLGCVNGKCIISPVCPNECTNGCYSDNTCKPSNQPICPDQCANECVANLNNLDENGNFKCRTSIFHCYDIKNSYECGYTPGCQWAQDICFGKGNIPISIFELGSCESSCPVGAFCACPSNCGKEAVWEDEAHRTCKLLPVDKCYEIVMSCASINRYPGTECSNCPYQAGVCCGEEIPQSAKVCAAQTTTCTNNTISRCKSDGTGWIQQTCGIGLECNKDGTRCETPNQLTKLVNKIKECNDLCSIHSNVITKGICGLGCYVTITPYCNKSCAFSCQPTYSGGYCTNPTSMRPNIDPTNYINELRSNTYGLYDQVVSASSLQEFINLIQTNTKVSHVNSIAELNQALWAQYPDLYTDLNNLLKTQGAYFDNSGFIAKYNNARSQNSSNVFDGVIIVRESDYAGISENMQNVLAQYPELTDVPFEVLEYISFLYPTAQQLQAARENGLLVPEEMQAQLVVIPDDLLDQTNLLSQDPRGITPIPMALHGNSYIPWPPNVDFLIYDDAPLSINTGASEINIPQISTPLPMAAGWIHEETHLMTAVDLYHSFIGSDHLVLDTDEYILPAAQFLKNWQNYNIGQAQFGLDDIMSAANPEHEITNITALQIAVASTQGAISTMQEGGGWLEYPENFKYEINVYDGNKNITPQILTSFGITATEDTYNMYGKDAFGDANNNDYKAQNIATTGTDYYLGKTYMVGIDIQQGEDIFTLPLPSNLNLLYRFSDPYSTSADKPFEVDIHVNNIPQEITKAQNKNSQLVSTQQTTPNPIDINITILTESELTELQQDSNNGVLATAKLDVHPDLTIQQEKQNFYLVWIAQPRCDEDCKHENL